MIQIKVKECADCPFYIKEYETGGIDGLILYTECGILKYQKKDSSLGVFNLDDSRYNVPSEKECPLDSQSLLTTKEV